MTKNLPHNPAIALKHYPSPPNQVFRLCNLASLVFHCGGDFMVCGDYSLF